jgi:hypothetical protein
VGGGYARVKRVGDEGREEMKSSGLGGVPTGARRRGMKVRFERTEMERCLLMSAGEILEWW